VWYLLGWEGVFGLIMAGAIIGIFSLIECDESIALCSAGHFANPSLAIEEWLNNSTIRILSLIYIVSATCQFSSGCMISKHSSALHRVVTEQMRILIIWIFFLITGTESFKFL
jgi:hypothetical protein